MKRGMIAKPAMELGKVEAALDDALTLTVDAGRAYRAADEQTRRRWNQAIFAKVYLRDDEVAAAELTDKYGALWPTTSSVRSSTSPPTVAKRPKQQPRFFAAGVLLRVF